MRNRAAIEVEAFLRLLEVRPITSSNSSTVDVTPASVALGF
jgi:hypothetical protein